MIYTLPQHNHRRGHPLDVPTHWMCSCHGINGYGLTPIEALAQACENWLVVNMEIHE